MPPPFLVLFLLLPTLVPNTISTPLPFSSIHSVTLDVHRNISAAQRRLLSSPSSSCLTGNPIDDCWRCDPNWPSNRHRLADCGVGFGREALGGKHGHPYLVTDSSDSNPANPKPGTLRYAVVQEDPLWITFSSSMTIHLSAELLINSFKTLDARGSSVHLTGKGCVTLQYVSNVILHGLHIHHCSPSPPRKLVMSTPTHVGLRSPSDGDAISIYSSRKIWIDHCSLSYCSDGLVDAVMGSTAITVSNCHFSHHNDVMLLGHSDGYRPDKAMQVTIAFNVFGAALVQRMPRCRHGYFHVVNNDYRGWEMYAIGGSAAPTVNSQGNRYRAPENPNAKEVTKRVDSNEGAWGRWDWRSVGDEMVNGAVFIASGEGAGIRYDKASSVEPKSAGMLDRITANAGVIGDSFREDESGGTYSSGGSTNGYEGNGRHSSSSSSSGGGGGNRAEGSAFSGYLGMIYAGRNGLASSASSSQVSDFFYSFAGLVTLFMFSSCGDLWRF